jgi:hypothetical protein
VKGKGEMAAYFLDDRHPIDNLTPA